MAADKARCIAAAEGVLVLRFGMLGARLGLTSWLLLRDLSPLTSPALFCCLWGGLMGEESLEDCGEVTADVAAETLREGGALEVPLGRAVDADDPAVVAELNDAGGSLFVSCPRVLLFLGSSVRKRPAMEGPLSSLLESVIMTSPSW